MLKKYYIRKDEGFEIQFYDKDGNASHVIYCSNGNEVALVLSNWCWTRVSDCTPTIWLDGQKYGNVPLDISNCKTTALTEEKSHVSIPTLFDNISLDINGKVATKYDCTKVCVGEDVYEACKDEYIGKGGDEVGFATLWCFYGPKATLQGYDVEVEEGWCTL